MRKFLLLIVPALLAGLSSWADDDVPVFNLENPVVREYIQNVEYPFGDCTYSSIESYQNMETTYRKDLPFPVTLSRPTSATGKLVVKTYLDNSLVRTDTIAANGKIEIYNLIPGNLYTYKIYNSSATLVASGKFKTAGQVRMLNAPDMRNFRDIGGWPIPGGKRVRYDRIFRCADLIQYNWKYEGGEAKIDTASPIREKNINAKGLREFLDNIGIRAELDFGEFKGTPAKDSIDRWGLNFDTAMYVFAENEPYKIDGYRTGLSQAPFSGVYDNKHRYYHCFQFILKALRENKKVIFHCNGGADRTGTVAFLLEGLLGVSESDLCKDYELTTFQYPEKIENKYSDRRVRYDWNGYNWYPSILEYIKEFNEKLGNGQDSFRGQINTLLASPENIGGFGIPQSDIDEFRKLMTDTLESEGDTLIFDLENPVTSKYITKVDYSSDTDYTYTAIETYRDEKTSYRKDLPSPVTLPRPENASGSVTVKVYYDNNLVRTDKFEANEKLEIYNLIPKRLYSYKIYNQNNVLLTDGVFKTKGQVRMINVPEMRNFRDIGGWPLQNGKRVKYDRIFRSAELGEASNNKIGDALTFITEKGVTELTGNLGINVEIDFGDYYGSPLENASGYDFYGPNPDPDEDPSPTQIKDYRAGIGGFYGTDRYDAKTDRRPQYKNCFNIVVNSLKANKKLVFHCSAGADRTGTFAFLLEGLLGVSESDLSKDYELTSFSKSRSNENWDTRRRDITYKVYPEWGQTGGYKDLVEYIKTLSGSTLKDKIETFFLSIGVKQDTINAYRSLMTEDTEYVVLDETATKAPEAISYSVNAELKRSISSGKWNTIVLPFDLTGSQLKNAFGTDVKVAEFTSWSTTSANSPKNIIVKFTSIDTSKGIKANHPYIIKVTKKVTDVPFKGVYVIPTGALAELQVSGKVGNTTESALFIGTYKKVLLPAKSLFISDNKFWYSTGKTMMKGYRAYLSLPVVV
ncbi:MAG: tyrosine-protein phosphatase, partial [Prevotella sp.]|nr:tyrosine-protein phosphatase [Prevotella sp.]